MIRFLFKGILRDSQRSRLPILIISIGVFLTVVLSAWMNGILGDMIDLSAKFTTGHVKIMTQAYAENEAQIPNDLALLDVEALTQDLESQFPDMQWVERIRFGGLMDLPDSEGETQAQGPVSAQGIALLDRNKGEIERLGIEKSLVRGRLPERPGEILISDAFAQKIHLQLDDTLTFFGSTMHGSMTFQNFKAVGTVRFGSVALDRGSILVDLADARQVLDMNDAAGEILGYFASNKYEANTATEVMEAFNSTYQDAEDEFSPIMLRLQDQNGLDQMLAYMDVISGVFVFLFVFAMSIVLWNTGLLGGLRRYKEFGIRLAMGEEKSHIYRTLLYEAVLIGMLGSSVGTALGLGAAWYLQEVGLDFSAMMQSSAMMMPSVYRANIQPSAFFIGFIPGLFSMVLGNALSGIGIYRRQTAQLFKELEV